MDQLLSQQEMMDVSKFGQNLVNQEALWLKKKHLCTVLLGAQMVKKYFTVVARILILSQFKQVLRLPLGKLLMVWFYKLIGIQLIT